MFCSFGHHTSFGLVLNIALGWGVTPSFQSDRRSDEPPPEFQPQTPCFTLFKVKFPLGRMKCSVGERSKSFFTSQSHFWALPINWHANYDNITRNYPKGWNDEVIHLLHCQGEGVFLKSSKSSVLEAHYAAAAKSIGLANMLWKPTSQGHPNIILYGLISCHAPWVFV